MSKDDVQSGLKAGKSIKDLAQAQGKDVNDVIDALVTAADAKIDQAVKDGKLKQDAADQIKSGLKQRITSVVENGLPKLPDPGQWGGPRFGHRGGSGESGTPAPGAPSDRPTSPGTTPDTSPTSPTSPSSSGASDSAFLGVA